MKWYHILIIIAAILLVSLAFAALPLKSGLAMIFTTIFIFYFTGKSYIWDNLSEIKLKLVHIEISNEVYLKTIHGRLDELRNQVEYLKTMLQLQEIRERQQDKTGKTEGKSDEAL